MLKKKKIDGIWMEILQAKICINFVTFILV